MIRISKLNKILFGIMLGICISNSSSAQTATINGSTAGTLQGAYSLNNAGYYGNAFVYGSGGVELIIKDAPKNCIATVEAYRTNSSYVALTGSTTIYGNSIPNWSSPTAANPSGVNYCPTCSTFYKCVTGYPTATLAYGAGVSNPNGTYNISLSSSSTPPATYDGYYVVNVNFTFAGVTTTQTFKFIIQPTNQTAFATDVNLTVGGTSCSSRTATANLTITKPHFSPAATIATRLYRNGSPSGSAVNYTTTGGTPASVLYPSLTMPNITLNGTYYLYVTEQYVATGNATTWGSNVYLPPLFSPNTYVHDMTTGLPYVSGTLKGGPDNSVRTGGNLATTAYGICQQMELSAGPPKVYDISPLNFFITGTNGSTGRTTTATLTRYTDTTYTTVFTGGALSFPQTIASGTQIDGNYDLTTMFSNYLSTLTNGGFYKIVLSYGSSSCNATTGTSSFFFEWLGVPIGGLEVGRYAAGAFVKIGDFHKDSSGAAGASCANPLVICKNSPSIYLKAPTTNTGNFSGIKVLMTRLSSGSCSSSPVWDTIINGLKQTNPSNLSYWNAPSPGITSFSNATIKLYDYMNDVDIYTSSLAPPLQTDFATDYTTGWTLGGTYKFTILLYNKSCLSNPIVYTLFALRASNVSVVQCKTDVEGDDEILDRALSNFTAIAFPNPSIDNVSIAIEGPSKTQMLIKVFDIMGKVVMEKQVKKVKEDMQAFPLDLSSLATGTFMYQVINLSTGEKLNGKFTKAN